VIAGPRIHSGERIIPSPCRAAADLVAAYENLGAPSNAAYVGGDISNRQTDRALVD